jgi:hypothetical protein
MKRPKFTIGQAVVALKSEWLDADEIIQMAYPVMPSKGRVYHVLSMAQIEGEWYLTLVECSAMLGFEEKHFAPFQMLSQQAIDEVLAAALVPLAA